MKKVRTYMDKLKKNKEFHKRFKEEYQNLCIGEQVARVRHQAHLTQAALAKRIHTTKSAVSRYESADYSGYSLPLLKRVAKACEADLKIMLVGKRTKCDLHAISEKYSKLDILAKAEHGKEKKLTSKFIKKLKKAS